ncbi:MAG: hypothetical protein HPY85_14395 [Anaerolineae bacterium]|nr:hypothetical protein [Anaerolineae bacterium]
MDLFQNTCPYCNGKLATASAVYCPHCGTVLRVPQGSLDDERIQCLYHQADQFFAEEEWSDGIYLLVDALRLDPENAETRQRLKEARHQYRLARLYEWAEEHYFAGSYNEAMDHLDEIASEDPDYRDVREMIERIQVEKPGKKSKQKRRQGFRRLFDLGIQWVYVFLISIFLLVFAAAVFLLVGHPF